MPEYEHAVTPDAVHTRERMRVLTRSGPTISDVHPVAIGGAHSGVIPYDPDFLNTVLYPSAQSDVESLVNDAGQIGSGVFTERWLDTPSSGLFPNYEGTQRVITGASHVHDYDPRVLMGELELEILTEFAAAHPTATILSNGWDYTPGEPFGTYANRAIEVTSEQTISSVYTRGGDLIVDQAAEDIPVGVVAIPYEDADLLGDTATYGASELGVPADSWQSSVLESRTVEDGPVVQASDHAVEVGTTDPGTGALTFGVSDSWWSDYAWPIESGDGYPSRGLPLMTVPVIRGMWSLGGLEAGDPFGGATAELTGRRVEIHFESDWQPPTYRITYEETTAPALRLYPRDPDRRGWSAGARIYPPPRSNRIYPPHQ
jgi:hypothetical protein